MNASTLVKAARQASMRQAVQMLECAVQMLTRQELRMLQPQMHSSIPASIRAIVSVLDQARLIKLENLCKLV